MRIGFIGTGNMGSAMIGHLTAAGHAVGAYARSHASRERARALSVRLASTPAALAGQCEVVFTNVTATADVEEVVLGRDGVIEGGQPGLVHIDMSTISPLAARRIAAELGAKGIESLDAPVSGGAAGARAAALTIFIGGKREVYERVRPLLECLGKTFLYMGTHGAGQVTKLANQIAQLANLQGAAEALIFATHHGVDPAAARDAILSGQGASAMLDLLGKKMVERDFEAGIVAALHHKDLGVALDIAHRAGLPLPASAQVLQQLNALMGNGWGDKDTSILLRVLERAAGNDRGE